jgi:hypothetical protein
MNYCIEKYGITPYAYLEAYINDIDNYCFQGGYGYSISYIIYDSSKNIVKNSPHHWCIKPEFSDKISIPEDILFFASITKSYIYINKNPAFEVWGS